jgi:hypothetical protein
VIQDEDKTSAEATQAAAAPAAKKSSARASAIATQAAAEAPVDTIDIELAVVQIDRDSTVSIPVTCYEYEVEVLKEIHGELNVREISTRIVTVPAFNAADAYAQLMRKYRQHVKLVKAVYRGPKELARASGLSYQKGDDQAVEFQQSEVVDNSVPRADPEA